MKLSHFFTLNAILSLPFGIAFVLAPAWVLSLYGAASNPVLNLVGRFFGVELIAVGLVCWLVRYIDDDYAQRGIVTGLLLASLLGIIVAFFGVFNGVTNAMGWLNVAIYAVLAIGYAYFLSRMQTRRQVARHT